MNDLSSLTLRSHLKSEVLMSEIFQKSFVSDQKIIIVDRSSASDSQFNVTAVSCESFIMTIDVEITRTNVEISTRDKLKQEIQRCEYQYRGKSSLSTTMNTRRSSIQMKSVISSLVFNRENDSLISIWCRYYSHSIDQKRLWYYTASMHHLRAAISNSIWRCDDHWVAITIASFFHAAFKVTERCLMWISNVSSFDSMTLLSKTYQIQRWCWSSKSDWFTSWQNERIKIEISSQLMR